MSGVDKTAGLWSVVPQQNEGESAFAIPHLPVDWYLSNLSYNLHCSSSVGLGIKLRSIGVAMAQQDLGDIPSETVTDLGAAAVPQLMRVPMADLALLDAIGDCLPVRVGIVVLTLGLIWL